MPIEARKLTARKVNDQFLLRSCGQGSKFCLYFTGSRDVKAPGNFDESVVGVGIFIVDGHGWSRWAVDGMIGSQFLQMLVG